MFQLVQNGDAHLITLSYLQEEELRLVERVDITPLGMLAVLFFFKPESDIRATKICDAITKDSYRCADKDEVCRIWLIYDKQNFKTGCHGVVSLQILSHCQGYVFVLKR
jgi:hypothetical protein